MQKKIVKITICAYDAPNNIDGPTTWLKRLLPYLRERGIESRILFLANPSKNLGTLRFFEARGFACKLISAELFFEEQMQAIIEDIAQNPPDVFFPNYFPVAGYAGRYIKKAGIPTVMVLHNDDAHHRLLVTEFARRVREEALSCVVPVSQLLKKDIEALKLSDTLVHCIAYGAPVPKQKAVWNGSSSLRIIYLGRLNNHQKRINDVTRAFCRATKEVPQTEAVIYGSGDALPEVLKIIASEKAEDKVKYGGVLGIGEIQEKLLEGQVFVLLSEFEGIPVALMEAMGCGLVPVCSDIKSGITELITDGENGFVVKDRDQAFVEAIKRLATQPEIWNRCAAAARAIIEEQYSETACHDKWVDLLETLSRQNSFSGKLSVPDLRALKALKIHPALLHTETRVPHAVMVPLHRIKKVAGRVKRNFFE